MIERTIVARYTRGLILAVFTGLLFSSVVGTVQAQTCGDIVAPRAWFEVVGNQIERRPIIDCNNPFPNTTTPPNPYQLSIEGQSVNQDGQVSIPKEGTRNVTFTGEPSQMFVDLWIFKHEGGDLVYQDESPSEMTDADFLSYLDQYFSDQADRDFFRTVFLAEDKGQYLYNPETGEDILDSNGNSLSYRYYEFIDAARSNYVPIVPAIGVGTYTFVWREYDLILGQRTWGDTLREWLIPTAYAQEYLANTYSVTVTLVEKKEGASSVLFLPGIQASTLHIGDDTVWPPATVANDDIFDLRMSVTGESVNNIHTEAILQNIPYGGTVYASFSSFMDGLVQPDKIAGWKSYAYDWRYRVDTIANNGTQYEDEVLNAITEIEKLAEDSYSEKVTIIGHSNGGLLAKAIMQRLESEGRAELIDKVVLLASPQLGTPKSIGTILHGYDQTDNVRGVVINAQSAREVINNMPGAYGLLPSERFFDNNSTPIIEFKDGGTTDPYRSVYGTQISNYDQYINFLRGNDGLNRNLNNGTNIPATANSLLLQQSEILHESLDNWTAPEGVQVIEIVGTGLATMKSVEYRNLVEDECLISVPINLFCTPKDYLKPYAVLTKYGDGTVVQRSAEGYVGIKDKYFVNLKRLEEVSVDVGYVHHNITEAEAVQTLISELITGSSVTNNEFISPSYTEFNDEYDVEVIDSPVRILVTDKDGKQTGVILDGDVEVIKEEIPGSQYFEFGDSKYVVIPKGTNRTTKLFGEAYGGYSLTTASLGSDDNQVVNTFLANASVTPTMVAGYSNTDGEYSTVQTDLDGDGTIDIETNLEGEIVLPPEEVTYQTVLTKVEAIPLSKSRKQALIVILKSAEHYSNKVPSRTLFRRLEDALLKAAEDLVRLYVKKKFISREVGDVLIEDIGTLKDKQ